MKQLRAKLFHNLELFIGSFQLNIIIIIIIIIMIIIIMIIIIMIIIIMIIIIMIIMIIMMMMMMMIIIIIITQNPSRIQPLPSTTWECYFDLMLYAVVLGVVGGSFSGKLTLSPVPMGLHKQHRTMDGGLKWMAQRWLVWQPWESRNAPSKINMEPKNGGLEDHFPFQLDDFFRFEPSYHFLGRF